MVFFTAAFALRLRTPHSAHSLTRGLASSICACSNAPVSRPRTAQLSGVCQRHTGAAMLHSHWNTWSERRCTHSLTVIYLALVQQELHAAAAADLLLHRRPPKRGIRQHCMSAQKLWAAQSACCMNARPGVLKLQRSHSSAAFDRFGDRQLSCCCANT